jgi:hypothetical protein
LAEEKIEKKLEAEILSPKSKEAVVDDAASAHLNGNGDLNGDSSQVPIS